VHTGPTSVPGCSEAATHWAPITAARHGPVVKSGPAGWWPAVSRSRPGGRSPRALENAAHVLLPAHLPRQLDSHASPERDAPQSSGPRPRSRRWRLSTPTRLTRQPRYIGIVPIGPICGAAHRIRRSACAVADSRSRPCSAGASRAPVAGRAMGYGWRDEGYSRADAVAVTSRPSGRCWRTWGRRTSRVLSAPVDRLRFVLSTPVRPGRSLASRGPRADR
jgi:hypothetical protein